jgi:hypothetical protein
VASATSNRSLNTDQDHGSFMVLICGVSSDRLGCGDLFFSVAGQVRVVALPRCGARRSLPHRTRWIDPPVAAMKSPVYDMPWTFH